MAKKEKKEEKDKQCTKQYMENSRSSNTNPTTNQE
jgi:hypothetical protein